MAKYNISFNGRQTGAIGVFYKITEVYNCKNMDELKSCLYRDYEHISQLYINGSIDLKEYNTAKFIDVPKRNYSIDPIK